MSYDKMLYEAYGYSMDESDEGVTKAVEHLRANMEDKRAWAKAHKEARKRNLVLRLTSPSVPSRKLLYVVDAWMPVSNDMDSIAAVHANWSPQGAGALTLTPSNVKNYLKASIDAVATPANIKKAIAADL